MILVNLLYCIILKFLYNHYHFFLPCFGNVDKFLPLERTCPCFEHAHHFFCGSNTMNLSARYVQTNVTHVTVFGTEYEYGIRCACVVHVCVFSPSWNLRIPIFPLKTVPKPLELNEIFWTIFWTGNKRGQKSRKCIFRKRFMKDRAYKCTSKPYYHDGTQRRNGRSCELYQKNTATVRTQIK